MDTKTGHKQPQVLLRGGGLSGSVYKNFPPPFISFLNLSCFVKIHVHSPKSLDETTCVSTGDFWCDFTTIWLRF